MGLRQARSKGGAVWAGTQLQPLQSSRQRQGDQGSWVLRPCRELSVVLTRLLRGNYGRSELEPA